MATRPRRLTALDVPDVPLDPDVSGYELVDGELVPVMPAKRRHSWLMGEVFARVRAHAMETGQGAVYQDVWCRLPVPGDPERLRAPDVAWFGGEKLAEAGESEIFPFPPDLAIEIHSPRDQRHPGDFQRRVRDYIEAGTPLLLVVYPDAGYAMAHRPDGSARMVRETETLDGEEVLPGLHIELGELFEGMP